MVDNQTRTIANLPMARHVKQSTPKTQKALNEIVAKCYDGSGTRLIYATGNTLDKGALSRVLKGTRPATPEFVGAILRILTPELGIKLMTALLSDTADHAAQGFGVTVKMRSST